MWMSSNPRDRKLVKMKAKMENGSGGSGKFAKEILGMIR